MGYSPRNSTNCHLNAILNWTYIDHALFVDFGAAYLQTNPHQWVSALNRMPGGHRMTVVWSWLPRTWNHRKSLKGLFSVRHIWSWNQFLSTLVGGPCLTAVPQHSSFRMAKQKFERGRSCEEIPWPCPNPQKSGISWNFISMFCYVFVLCSIFMEKWGELGFEWTWMDMNGAFHPETQRKLSRVSSVSQCQLWIAHRTRYDIGNSTRLI